MAFMIRRRLAALFPCVLLLFAAHGGAQSPEKSHADIELIAEQSTASPGKPLWVGLSFRLDEGWHIYWQNPGDSGQPPTVTWQLPAGFTAGAIRWPQPVRLVSGTVVDYGYEGQTLLMVPIQAAAPGHATLIPPVSADVKYIVCRDICIPGKAHLTLATSATGNWARWRALFEQARQQLPKPAPRGWKVSAESDRSQFVLTVRGAQQVHSATFFPLDAGQIDNAGRQNFVSSPTGFRLSMKKSDLLVQPVAKLRGLIVLEPGRAFEVEAPVISR
jgi:thiol:disulfide interchange protein DsbD